MKNVSLLAGAILAVSLSTQVSAGQFVITTHDKATDLKSRMLSTLPEMEVKRRMRDQRRWVVNLPENAKQRFIQQLTESGLVLSVEPDIWVTAQYVPNDSSISSQWSLFEDAAGIRLWDALDIADGSGSVVAVVDTGYVPHPDLDANRLDGYDIINDAMTARDGDGRDSDAIDEGDYTRTWQCGYNSDSSWHGSHVAGIATGVADNGEGITGVAPGAKFVPVRVLGTCGGYLSDIADGVSWSAGLNVDGLPINANPADVINLSLGGSGSCTTYMQSAIDDAVAAGSVVVVAAGNESTDASSSTPANCNNVITVAAVGRDGSRASYSNFGSVVDIAAPGGDGSSGILSTIDSGTRTRVGATYAEYQGTSMATPHVAGLVALMRSADPDLTPAEITDILLSTAREFPSSCNGCGIGIIDATAALTAVSGGGSTDPVWASVTYGGNTRVRVNDAYPFPVNPVRVGSTEVVLSVASTGRDATAEVTIIHPAQGELDVTLTAPDGSQSTMTLVGSNSVLGRYKSTPASIAGDYTLTIVDNLNGNRGTLINFSMTQEEEQ